MFRFHGLSDRVEVVGFVVSRRRDLLFLVGVSVTMDSTAVVITGSGFNFYVLGLTVWALRCMAVTMDSTAVVITGSGFNVSVSGLIG